MKTIEQFNAEMEAHRRKTVGNTKRLEPDEGGHYPCPYCERVLTPIFRMWIPRVTDYICSFCKIGFKV